MTVKKSFVRFISPESLINILRCHCDSNWQAAARQSLRQTQDIRRSSRFKRSKQFACPPKTRHHFIVNQQYIKLARKLCDRPQKLRATHPHSRSTLYQRLDKNARIATLLQQKLQFLQTRRLLAFHIFIAVKSRRKRNNIPSKH